MSSRLSLRRLLAILLGALGVLVAALFTVTTLQLRGASFQAEAENRRAESFRLADRMRQSSNDLTTMVRLYVVTGDARYRAYYDEILAIRAGTAPRPRGYDRSFWSRVLAQGKGFVKYGSPESLAEQMRAAGLEAEEFAALNASLDASNRLARHEVEVMERVAGSGVGHPDFRRLIDSRYLARKGVIMDAADRFIALVERRTARELERVRRDNRNLVVAQIGLLALIVLAGVAARVALARLALRPLARLIAAKRRFASGHYAERAHIRGVSELEHMAAAFNEMADAVQSDVAARERAERAAVQARSTAERASRAKSTFLAAMSHEIRTPMLGVTGMLDVLGQSALTPGQRQTVATAQDSARSLMQVIGDVLDFSKIEAGRLELAPTTFALGPLIGAAVDSFVHSASAKSLLLTCSEDERLADAHVGDPLRLRQIVGNLVSNAVKFTETGGIEVSVRVLGESTDVQTVEVAVSDTGVGVPLERQRRLFEEFSQAEAGTALRFGGTGLGLAICRRLAGLMGGEVAMESAAGEGCTMRLTVPLRIGDPTAIDPATRSVPGRPPTARSKPSRAQAEREGSVLLLAEDHPVNRTVLSRQLDLIGFHTDTAGDGEEAFEKYLSGRYRLVLTDLHMPRLDGCGLARAIRRHEAETGAERIPIVALSAGVMQGEPGRCAAAGMDDFAAKPATMQVLAAKLHRWLPGLDWPVEPAAPGMRLDGAVLDELTGGDAVLAAAVLRDFITTSRDDVRALGDAVSARDAERVRRQAHRIAGAGRVVGAGGLAAPAKRLEDAAAHESPDWAAICLLADDLDAALAEIAESARVRPLRAAAGGSALPG